jgi:hypothetical protein
MSFSCCSATWACWVSRSLSCSPMAARRDRASRARSSRPWASACLGLLLELVGLLLQLGRLELDPLAGGGHVGHAAADLWRFSICFS